MRRRGRLGVSSGYRLTLRGTVSGQLSARPVEQCSRCFQGGGSVLGAEHIGRQLIAEGIRIARGGVELVEQAGLPLPVLGWLVAQLAEQACERMAAQVSIW